MRISARKLASLTGLIATTCLVVVACGGGATGPQPPKAASDVSATAGPGYITISWTDNSDDETGFKGIEDVHYRTEGWDFIVAGGGIYNNLDYSFVAY